MLIVVNTNRADIFPTPGYPHLYGMRAQFLGLAMALSTLAYAGNGDKVLVKVNGKDVKSLTESLYLKPGSYKAPPKTAYKRAELKDLAVTAPTDGLDGPQDSLTVKVTGYSGSIGYFKTQQNVAPGGTASFSIAEPAAQDFTPNGRQQTLLGRFEVEVIPMKRSNVKGMYKGTISVE